MVDCSLSCKRVCVSFIDESARTFFSERIAVGDPEESDRTGHNWAALPPFPHLPPQAITYFWWTTARHVLTTPLSHPQPAQNAISSHQTDTEEADDWNELEKTFTARSVGGDVRHEECMRVGQAAAHLGRIFGVKASLQPKSKDRECLL